MFVSFRLVFNNLLSTYTHTLHSHKLSHTHTNLGIHTGARNLLERAKVMDVPTWSVIHIGIERTVYWYPYRHMASLPFDLSVYSLICVCRSMALSVRLYSCQMVKTGCMYLCADIAECTSVCARYLLRALSISSLFSMHNYTREVSVRTFALFSRLLADFSRNCSMTNQ